MQCWHLANTSGNTFSTMCTEYWLMACNQDNHDLDPGSFHWTTSSTIYKMKATCLDKIHIQSYKGLLNNSAPELGKSFLFFYIKLNSLTWSN